MKQRMLGLLLCLMVVTAVFGACQHQPDSSAPASTQSSADPTDKELLLKIVKDPALELWGVLNAPAPNTMERVYAVAEECQPLRELLAKESAKESIRLYAPDIVEELYASELLSDRADAQLFADMMATIQPDIAQELDSITQE